MPTSSKEGKSVIREWITEFKDDIKVVLDLGVGSGTYHRLFVRKSNLLRDAKWIGVEAWEPYINEYDLIKRYDTIINEDICKIDFSVLNDVDLVLAGDVLEHMTKEDAVRVINDLLQISKNIIISIPIVYYPQDEIDGNPFEIHIKDNWSHTEMMESFPQIKRSWQGSVIGVYLLHK
jgi:SAM-dependent methyltransferase